MEDEIVNGLTLDKLSAPATESVVGQPCKRRSRPVSPYRISHKLGNKLGVL